MDSVRTIGLGMAPWSGNAVGSGQAQTDLFFQIYPLKDCSKVWQKNKRFPKVMLGRDKFAMKMLYHGVGITPHEVSEISGLIKICGYSQVCH